MPATATPTVRLALPEHGLPTPNHPRSLNSSLVIRRSLISRTLGSAILILDIFFRSDTCSPLEHYPNSSTTTTTKCLPIRNKQMDPPHHNQICHQRYGTITLLPRVALHRQLHYRKTDVFLAPKLEDHVGHFKAFAWDARLRKDWDAHYECPVCHFHVAALLGTAHYLKHLYTHLPKEQQMFQSPGPTCDYAYYLRGSVHQHYESQHGTWTPSMDRFCENKASIARHHKLLRL